MDDLQVLADPTRREIIRLVWDGERAAGDLAAAFDVTFGAVSQHLRILRDAGMVRVRGDGNRRLYEADRDRLDPYRAVLERMWAATLDRLAEAVESDDER
jgi:DNA-binding transcriptional ArsR family regulator